MITSKIWYKAQFLDLTKADYEKLDKLILDYIWNNKLQLIEKHKLELDSEQGGFNLINIRNKITAFGVNYYIKTLINKKNIANFWKNRTQDNVFYENIKRAYFDFKTKKGASFVENKIYKIRDIYYTINKSDIQRIENAKLLRSRLIDGRKKTLNWKILHDGVPNGENLNKKGITFANKLCTKCNLMETTKHTFLECTFTKRISEAVCKDLKINKDIIRTHLDSSYHKDLSSAELITLTYIRHNIWIARCQRNFDKIYLTVTELTEKIKAQLRSYNKLMKIYQSTDF